jgi:hypothetical protein
MDSSASPSRNKPHFSAFEPGITPPTTISPKLPDKYYKICCCKMRICIDNEYKYIYIRRYVVTNSHYYAPSDLPHIYIYIYR